MDLSSDNMGIFDWIAHDDYSLCHLELWEVGTDRTLFPNTMIQSSKRSNTMSFPRKLHAMLEYASKCSLKDVISWHSSGKSLKVIQPQGFASEIMAADLLQSNTIQVISAASQYLRLLPSQQNVGFS
jgi:hypothetical protein